MQHPPLQPLPDQLNPPAAPLANGSSSSQPRMANDLRNRAPLPVPSAPGAHLQQNGHARNMSAIPPFEMARSPPNPASKSMCPRPRPPAGLSRSVSPAAGERRRAKGAGITATTLPLDTKHVPCKFFRQGACQAGPACPFLHSTDSTVDSAPCKYFTKGNCKFGAKCALAHILPDGRRVNRPNMGMGMGGSHLNLGGRVNPPPFHAQDSALANSLLSQQRMNGHGPRFSYPYPGQDDMSMLHGQPPQPPPYDIPTIDAGLVQDSGSKYGSPVDETRLPMSPIGRTALDAPLPASFDSQGISYMARHGPIAASLPSGFGMDYSSPPPSKRPGPPSDIIRNLHDTAFGLDSRKPQTLGSSPPVVVEEGSAPRLMHSQRVTRPKILSASLPRPGALVDWEDDQFSLEEDYVPTNLHDDVLTPQERMRRLSRTEQDSNSGRDVSGIMSGTSSSKVGSPLASSPSRFGAIFAKQRQRRDEDGPSSIGHVGSPLRESSLGFHSSSPSLRPIGSRPGSGDVSPFVASPSRQSGMSMISQQLSSTSLHPSSARHSSAGPGNRLDRAVSSPVSTSRIDEEQSDLVFSMEEEENNKRNSMIWNSNKTATSTDDPSSSSTGAAAAADGAGRGQDSQSNQDGKGKTLLKEMESLYGGRA
ncbi:hypothetical protein FQN52_006872 [Onygenales sp. PD_12]|nr:hypothetical protein FQN52_006872 [Onygenales sp. PD_12]